MVTVWLLSRSAAAYECVQSAAEALQPLEIVHLEDLESSPQGKPYIDRFKRSFFISGNMGQGNSVSPDFNKLTSAR